MVLYVVLCLLLITGITATAMFVDGNGLIWGSAGLWHDSQEEPEPELVVVGPDTMSEMEDGPPTEQYWVLLYCPDKVVLPLTAHDSRAAAEESVVNTTFDAVKACADWSS